MNNTTPRLLVASLLSPATDQLIREWYQTSFHHLCPVRTLHLTFIPPFTSNQINLLPAHDDLIPHTFTANQPSLFTHPDRTILYLPIIPPEPLTIMYHHLHQKFDSFITPESATIPDFLPHLTLDYHFTGEIIQTPPPPQTLTLLPPQLLTETAPGIWQPRNTN